MGDIYEENDTSVEEVTSFLENLRQSGACNMFGAGSYLQDEFGFNRRDASTVLKKWMGI